MQNRAALSKLAEALGGLPILGCLEGSPADEAGVRYGDVLLAIDGMATRTWDDFLQARAKSQGRFLARIFRDGAEFEIEVPLKPATKSPLETLLELVDQRLGGDGGAEVNGGKNDDGGTN